MFAPNLFNDASVHARRGDHLKSVILRCRSRGAPGKGDRSDSEQREREGAVHEFELNANENRYQLGEGTTDREFSARREVWRLQ